jgi:hypothetical protein
MALSNSPHRRLLDGTDEDPLSTVANLFDASMVLTVALLVALASRWQAMEIAADSPQPQETQPLPRVRPGESLLTGEGQRLGTAYQLKSGEIVYVP